MLTGVYTALVTPFKKNKQIDWEALRKLIRYQLKQKVSGFVVCGTTAESATLDRDEKTALFKYVMDECGDEGVTLIAGTGTNNTSETIEWTKKCASFGYKHFLAVTPYYNKPTQRGLLAHYETLAAATKGDIILYNVPGRSQVSLSAETIEKCSKIKNITAIKEASGNLTFASEIFQVTDRKKFSLLSGDDPTYFPFLCLGGVGTISVASHVLGSELEKMTKLVAEQKFHEARKIHEKYFPLFQALFIETNPAPIKWILSELGIIGPDLRLPLVEITEATSKTLKPFLKML